MIQSMRMQYSKYIGVIGGRDIPRPLYDECIKIGVQLAQFNMPVINGGGSGVMEAVSMGVKKGKGITMGLLPGNIDEANKYIDFPIGTGIGTSRNLMLVRNSAVIVAIDGSYGTLSEIAYALQYHIPLTVYKSQWSNINGVHISHSINEIMEFIKVHL